MISYFRAAFPPEGPVDPAHSLAIQGGRAGARLTHNHERCSASRIGPAGPLGCTPINILYALHCRQYHYVLQSLTLWREVQNDIFKLWYCAEQVRARPGSGSVLTARATFRG